MGAGEDLIELFKTEKATTEELLPLIDAKSAKVVGMRNKLPLHYACEYKASIAVVEKLLEANPAAIRHKDDGQYLPLHWACQWGAEDAVIRKLLEVYPEAANEPNKLNKKPSHLAVMYQATKEVQGMIKEKQEALTAVAAG